MSIDKIDFESIDEEDLKELVDVEVPEGVRLDYKLTQYGKSDKDKREILKDVSSFSNTVGGHLLIGMGKRFHEQGTCGQKSPSLAISTQMASSGNLALCSDRKCAPD